MKLAELLKSIPEFQGIAPDLTIKGMQEDSRRIKPGDLFIAKGGTKTDGIRYLADAMKNGAIAAIVAAPLPGIDIPQIILADPAAAISPLADAFYGHPSRTVKVIGVTGTNGKTTTTYLIRHLLKCVGIKCGMVGTVQIDDGKSVVESAMTTPSPIDIAALLAAMRDNGCRACAIEVSSHALHQKRVGAIQFAAGAFTNLTGDHLDYHGTMDNYADAKAILFEMLPAGAAAIVNARDPASNRMVRNTSARILRYGIDRPADYRAAAVQIGAKGTRFNLHTPSGSAVISTPLVGMHNVENALTAAACCAEVFGLSPEQIAAGLIDAIGAPGRLQQVVAGQDFAVLVDYAHTDDALANVLGALRPLTRGKLRVLFGCGGDRDGTKRPRMAKVAEKMADAIYVTSDNPRTEDPAKIIDQIVAGFSQPSLKSIVVQPERRAAIQRIIGEAAAGDVVLLAGKGHENYQIVGATKHHFDDVEEAMRALK